MRRDRHYVGRAIRKPQPCSAESYLHHVACEIASGVRHVLVRGCDVAACSVVISSKVRCNAVTARSIQHKRQVGFAPLVNNCLRRLDHHLHLERACRQTRCRLKKIEDVRKGRDLFRHYNFWKRDYEVVWKMTAALFNKRCKKDVQRAKASLAQFFSERFYANAYEWRKSPFAHPGGNFSGGRSGVTILFIVRAIAVAVLEINTKIFDRLAAQFLRDAIVNRARKPQWFVLASDLVRVHIEPRRQCIRFV